MSASFNGTSSKLSISTPLITGYPAALFCWIKPANTTSSMMAFGVGDFSGAQDEFAIYCDGAGTGKMRAFARASGSAAADSTTSIDATNWQPVMAVFTNANSRTIYYAAGASVNETTNTPVTFANLDRTIAGARPITDSLWFSGLIAHLTIWQTTVPGSSEWTSLAGGSTPSGVSSGGLVDYWALTSTQGTNQTGTNGNVLVAANISDSADNPTLGGGGGSTTPLNVIAPRQVLALRSALQRSI